MSENINTQKFCPVCGRPNKSHDNYCISCGFSLSGEPSKNEIPDPTLTKKKGLILIFIGLLFLGGFFFVLIRGLNTGENWFAPYAFLTWASIFLGYGIYRLVHARSYIISVPPIEIKDEPNKTEITETLSRPRKRILFFMVLPLIGLFMIFPIMAFFMNKNLAQTFEGIVIVVFMAAIFLGFWALWTRSWTKLRTFSISDNYIRINTPKRPPLLIRWADFDTIQMYIVSSRRHSWFRMKFYNGQDLYLSYMIQRASDFRWSTGKKIRALIEQYAIRLNKQFISKKKIKGHLLEKEVDMI